MSSKKKGNNAFYFFMLDWAERQARKGVTVSKNLKEIAADPRCSEEWKNISPQQKGYYTAKAKNMRIKNQGDASKKTGIGEMLNQVEATEKEEQEFQQNMLQYIDSVVSMGRKHNNLQKLKFIFIHVNWFCKREVGINKYEFCPAEFAVAVFSLQDGIENIYHEVLKVKIPLGWKRDAIETSQQTHQIPIELEEGQSDFSLMYNKLIQLLKSNQTGNKFPPLFTTKDLTPAVKSFLTRMIGTNDQSIDDFPIYSIEALFGALRNAAMQNIEDPDCNIPLVVAENEFEKDILSFTCGFECDFHKLIDGTAQYCSKSVVKRWGFTICDYSCEFLGIEMIEGVHCPIEDPFLRHAFQTAIDNDNVDIRMRNLSIKDKKPIVEMNGVTESHRRKVSERSYWDEQRRRNESKPLEIIDYSTHNEFGSNNSFKNLPSRPLRLPKSIPHIFNGAEENTDLFNPNDFPPIGGKQNKMKKTAGIKLPLGRGHTNC